MEIVTSIGFKRIERQQFCINSWLSLSNTVTAIQTQGEADRLSPLFPQVKFIETDLIGTRFNKPNFVRIYALLSQAINQTVLILNSDIEIRSTVDVFNSHWSQPEDNELKLGIRWDEDPKTKELTLLKWGIDAFLITPSILSKLTDVGFVMGCPAWDYWIPLMLHRYHNYKITVNKEPELIHELHDKNWSDKDYRIGVSLLKRVTKLQTKAASLLVKELTGRL